MSGDIAEGSILKVVKNVYEDDASGILEMPFENRRLHLGLASGRIVSLDTDILGRIGVTPLGESPLPRESPEGASLSSFPGTREAMAAVVGFLAGALADLSRPGISVSIQFLISPVEPAEGGGKISAAAVLSAYFSQCLAESAVRAQLGNLARKLDIPADFMARASRIPLTPQQAFVLTRLQNGLSLHDLVLSCALPEDLTLRTALLLQFFGIIKVPPSAAPDSPRPAGPSPFGASSARPSGAGRKETVFSKEEPSPPPRRTEPRPAERKEESAPPAPPPAPAPPPRRPAEPPKESPAGTVPQDVREDVLDMAILVEKHDYYAVLDLAAGAAPEEVKKAYFDRTRKFHPDLFHSIKDPEFLKMVDAVFVGITTAYETLKDPVKRASYDERHPPQPKLAAAPASAPGAPPEPKEKERAFENQAHKALQHFTHGKEAFKQKKFFDAMEHFREAVRLEPEKPELQFMLGKTLCMLPQKLKEAEERLLKAEELSPNRIEFLLELALLYEKVQLKSRARRYWERVLEIDPENETAKHALGIATKKSAQLKDFLKMDMKSLFKGKK